MKKQKKSKQIHLKITPLVSASLLTLTSCNSFDENRLVCIDTTQQNKIVNKQFCRSIEESVDQQLKQCDQKYSDEQIKTSCMNQVEANAKNMKHPYAWYYMEKSVEDMNSSYTGSPGHFMYYFHQGFIHPSTMAQNGHVSAVAHPNSTISRSGFVSKSGGYVSVARGGFGGRSGFSS